MPTPPPTTRKPGFMSRVATGLQRLVLLAVVAGLVAVAGKYYGYDRLDEEIRSRFETQLREHYRGLAVSVESARRIPGRGVELRGIRLAQPGASGLLLAEIDELFAECDTRLPDFLTQPPAVQAVRIQRLKLRAERVAGGQWNLTGLMPLPKCGSGRAPQATVTDASIEFVDATQNPPCSWTLRNIGLTVTPSRGPEPPGDRESIAAGAHENESAAARTRPEPGSTLLVIHGSVAGDHFEKLEFEASLDAVSGAWDLRGTVVGLEFSPRLRAALPYELSQSLAPLASIRGRTQFGFHARKEGIQPGQPRQPSVQFAIEGEISEGRIDDTRLPEPLTDVAAKVRFDNRGLAIDDLSARCGSTELTLSLTSAGYDLASPCELKLTAQNLALDRLPVASLPAEVQAAWRRFSPRGVVDLSGRLAFDGRRWQPHLAIRCRELSILYDGFPYRLTDGAGTIDLEPDAAVVHLRLFGGGGQPVICRANVRQPGPNFVGWIELQSEGALPLDDKLLAALDPQAQRTVQAFHPRGSAAFQARFQRGAGETVVHRQVGIRLQECSIQHDKFRYPIDKISGRLERNDDEWLFHDLVGQNDSAAIAGEGEWTVDPQGGRLLTLRFHATDVPLAEELRQALSPEAQRLWSNLRPRGNLDQLKVGIRYSTREERFAVEIGADKWPAGQSGQGLALSIEPVWFRYRLDNVTGSFHYQNGVMQLSNLQAVHNRSALSGEAVCRVLNDGACRLEFQRLAADRIEVDRDLLAALPARLGAAIGLLSLEGPLNVLGKLGITVPPQAQAPPELDWDLSLDLEGGRIATALPVEHIHGGTRIVGNSGAAGIACRGEVLVDSAIVRGVQITRIAGPFWTDGERLVYGAPAERDLPGRQPRQITAGVFGGLVSTGGQVSFVGDGEFLAGATLERADLAQIARELAPHQRGLSGQVFAAVNISGTPAGQHTWRGGGQVRLRDADIYELPVMISLLKLLSIQEPDRTGFTSSDVDFVIEGDELALSRIDFSGDAISLKGRGRIDNQRELDLKFHPIVGRPERWLPLVRPIAGETGRQFLLIEVTGSLDAPHVRRTVFPRLDEQLEELFPELARQELTEPVMPILSLPGQALRGLRLLPEK